MRFKFTDEHKEFIVANIKNTEKKLLELFNNKFNADITISQLSNFKMRNKLKSGLVGGQFKKGHQSHNKGKKWSEYLSEEQQERARKTCFQKDKNINGQRHNWRNVGDERLSKDGFLCIRVAERNENKVGARYWIPKHRAIYEQYYGKIPKGSVVIFADGNRQNFNIENLLCVSRAELLTLNRYELIKKYSDLTKTGLVIAKLINKTNERRNKC